ncbi:MAG TPA: diguanylate cyclase [Aquabacterium sp.]|uniref:sensor domain-containing diguanylate cyclase n=1 Tax=Aquabacterium sp. TaxID=1872578 RepID=UPI002E359569|nr:diguanylate cyclase [Aquabacterium sp.]HEX5355995.1 diguanylate cyclase [Aquabacterium sp.]
MVVHTPTLFLVIVIASAVMGAAIAFIAHRQHANMLLWAAGLMLHALGYTLYSLRGQIPDVLSIVLANVAVSAMFALFGEGFFRFVERPAPRWRLWLPVLFVGVAFSFLQHSQHYRFMLAGVVFSFQSLTLLLALWQNRHDLPGRGAYILTAGALAVLLVMLMRLLGLSVGAMQVNAVTDTGLVQGVTFMAALVGVLWLSLGLVMMNQERAEYALQAERAADQFRSQILERLSAGQPLQQVLTAMVKGIEQLHPGMLCSVLLLDRQGQHLGEGVAPSLPDAYNVAIHGLAIGPGVGSCGTAAFTGERVVVEDISQHPYWAGYKELAARSGLGSCWSQPIRSSMGTVLGTFAIYHRQPHVPSPADIALIEQSASLASIAVERSREAEALRRSEQRYRRLIDTANEGICVVQGDIIRFANPKLCKQAGLAESEIVGQSFGRFIHEEDREMLLLNRRKRKLAGAQDFTYLVRVLTHHQGTRWFELSGTTIDWEGQSASLNFLTDVTDRKQMEERVRQLAYQDALTLLPNRRLLMDRLGLAMARHKRSGDYAALMFLDLDNFKPLNDRHGHDAGDMLLIEVAGRLKRCVREADTVARFGGDEFVIVLSDLGREHGPALTHAVAVAEKILAALTQVYQLAVPTSSGVSKLIEHHGSASIGLVLFKGEPGTEDECLKRADAAMYQAKQSGRRAIRVYEAQDANQAGDVVT